MPRPASPRSTLAGPAIALSVRGHAELEGATSRSALARGESLYLTPDESPLPLTGDGLIFIATTGERVALAGEPRPERAAVGLR